MVQNKRRSTATADAGGGSRQRCALVGGGGEVMRQRVRGQDSGERRLHGLKVRAGGVLNIGCHIHLPMNDLDRSISDVYCEMGNLNIYCPFRVLIAHLLSHVLILTLCSRAILATHEPAPCTNAAPHLCSHRSFPATMCAVLMFICYRLERKIE